MTYGRYPMLDLHFGEQEVAGIIYTEVDDALMIAAKPDSGWAADLLASENATALIEGLRSNRRTVAPREAVGAEHAELWVHIKELRPRRSSGSDPDPSVRLIVLEPVKTPV